MLYNKVRELEQLSMHNWQSKELFSTGWFVILGVLITTYVVWFILLDKTRAIQLLLLGALAAVAYSFESMFVSGIWGLVEYNIRLIPTVPTLLVTSVTISPITLMLVQQYTSTWKGYILWTSMGIAFLCFVIFPIYTVLGILTWHNWNVFFHFLVLTIGGICIRIVYLWIVGTQQRSIVKT